jgi:Recombination endonuclease VII
VSVCSKCKRPYTDKARGELKAFTICPGCRTECVTCGKRKPLDNHKQCTRCRASGKLCQRCSKNPIFSNTRLCWDCISTDDTYAVSIANNRDRIYGLAPGEYKQMLAEQGGLCAISNQPETSINKRTGKTYPLATDHDRACCPGYKSCGKCRRGLIRRNLNVALGMFGDDPELLRAAADYIERWREIHKQSAPDELSGALCFI